MKPSPRAVISAPLYENARHLPEAIESILGQTFEEFRLVLVDDASTDATGAVARSYAAQDPRVSVFVNERRLGLLDNTRRAFALALQVAPSAEYFALGSDHDVWHPTWLASLIDELERDPGIVLAYPHVQRISEDGEVVARKSRSFDTADLHSTPQRIRATLQDMVAGDMVYGLFRYDVLRRVGPYRTMLFPDRMQIAELSGHGRFRQLPEVLWSRRYTQATTPDRQRAAFFPDATPRRLLLPPWMIEVAVLGRVLVLQPARTRAVSRAEGLGLTVEHLGRVLRERAQSRSRPLRRKVKRLRRSLKRVPKAALRRVKRGRRLVKRVRQRVVRPRRRT